MDKVQEIDKLVAELLDIRSQIARPQPLRLAEPKDNLVIPAGDR